MGDLEGRSSGVPENIGAEAVEAGTAAVEEGAHLEAVRQLEDVLSSLAAEEVIARRQMREIREQEAIAHWQTRGQGAEQRELSGARGRTRTWRASDVGAAGDAMFGRFLAAGLVVGVVAIYAALLGGCSIEGKTEVEPPPTTVVFTYPADGQRDVPTGARLLVSFSEPIAAEVANTVAVIGPDGPVEIATTVVGGGKTIAIESGELASGAAYEVRVGEFANGEGLVHFLTRSDQPRAGAPSLVAFNGSDPAVFRDGLATAFRPVLETSTIQLVFSEPLDPRTVATEAGAIELVDEQGSTVAATLVAVGIHASLDPVEALVPGARYELRLGDRLLDLGGERFVPTSVSFVPVASRGVAPTKSVFRTRGNGDPAAGIARTDATNVMEVAHPLIGTATAEMLPAVLETELGDPMAMGGPIAFAIPKGQRLSSGGLSIALAGAIPSGLTTGDIAIEVVSDGSGRIMRNRFVPAETIPDNDRAPLLVDLSLDLAIYATDPTGNAVLAQTVLGVQLTGLAIADEGVLAIETLGALDIGLLGMSSAPTNIVLDLVSAPGEARALDTIAPQLLSSLPAEESQDLATDNGIELVLDEPIDLDRARAGGVRLLDGGEVPSTLELHGSVLVVRPRQPLAAGHAYRVELADVADRAGNRMEPTSVNIGTQVVAQTDVPVSVVSVQPGAPCTLVEGGGGMAGRCAGGASGDDKYRSFALAANERITVVFDQEVRVASLVLGAACGTGSVRVEQIDDAGACVGTVAGTLVRHLRDFEFVPDRPWQDGVRYQLRLVSGADATCSGTEVCGANGKAASFDPLAGTTKAGGPDLVANFIGGVASKATTLLAGTRPLVDANGSGRVDAGEAPGEDNRVALKIAGTGGLLDFAYFTGPDCIPSTPEVESCMYIQGMIPAQLGEKRENCVLPDGSTVATCIPVGMSAQAMYSTSIAMTAGALGIGIPTETGTSVMRVRERKDGTPLEGYIVDHDGTPTMVVALDLYMDAPDMSLPLAQHDMHSKPLSVSLEGPLEFQPDGRIAIALRNTAEVPISVGINAPLGISGTVKLIVPTGEMRLRLTSRAIRGSLP